jgi:outer membrane protein assembly factor BamB
LENGIVKLTRILVPALGLALLAGSATQILSAQAAKKDAKSVGLVPDWGQFRGPHRDGVSPDTDLLKEWPAGGPPLAWKTAGLGDGLSSVSVVGNKVFTMGDGTMLALDATTGKILWKAPTGDTTPAPQNQGGNGPRCTPACDGTLVYGITQSGTIVCIQAASGREAWRKSMKEFGGSEPGWGYSESPLIDGQLLICTPGGGKGSVVALNKMNGALAWQCAGVKESAQYTSVVSAEINKIPQYVVLTMKNLFGVSKTGQLLWQTDFPGSTAVCSSPIVKDNVVFASCGYGVGCKGVQISPQGKATELYADKQLTNHHGGAILVGDHIYGQWDTGLACVEIKTGKVAWRGGPGKGSIAVADGHIYCRTERGDVSLAEVSTEGYKEKGKFSLPSATKIPSWANPVVFGGKLYLRDEDTLYCYDVKAK